MFDFHRDMLSDENRTLAFREAIRRVVKPGDVVADLGSGTGILSFFALEAGAARVYAFEKLHIADAAALLARHNGYDDRYIVVHAYSLDATLPERADVLITETLGMFGLDEQILGLTIDARARYLQPGAIIVPRRVALSAVPVQLAYDYDRKVGWWDSKRYGLDLTPLRMFTSNILYGADIREDAWLAAPATLIDCDLRTNNNANVDGRATFTIQRDGICHGFGGWFDATLAPDMVKTLTNRIPYETHWMQPFMPLEEPVAVTRGDTIEFELQSRDGREWRWRGRIGNRAFDQMTTLSAPPCIHARK